MSNTDTTQSKGKSSGGDNPAADLIRRKINAIYSHEPDAKEEVEEVKEQIELDKPLSKHQLFMKNLTKSGKSLEEIQTSWHKYYSDLPDSEKHEVWQEFYAEHNKQQLDKNKNNEISSEVNPKVINEQSKVNHNFILSNDDKSAEIHTIQEKPKPEHHKRKHSNKTVSDVRKQLLGNVDKRAQTKLKAKQHFQSLLFGMGMGLIVVVIMLFSFFNDRFIAPFITPSKNVSSTPIIIDGNNSVASADPKIIIPKINVEIPVVYDEPSIEEAAVQKALERGVVHYATTPSPGEKGNAVIFGHSSNNILNRGNYKFAFVLLNRLEVGDTFYLNKDKVRYAYKIYDKKIVEPTDLSVLDSTEKESSVTLITCDPPGTTLKRLIVIGEQISPDPANNKASTAIASSDKPSIIPSNAPSLWSRILEIFR